MIEVKGQTHEALTKAYRWSPSLCMTSISYMFHCTLSSVDSEVMRSLTTSSPPLCVRDILYNFFSRYYMKKNLMRFSFLYVFTYIFFDEKNSLRWCVYSYLRLIVPSLSFWHKKTNLLQLSFFSSRSIFGKYY